MRILTLASAAISLSLLSTHSHSEPAFHRLTMVITGVNSNQGTIRSVLCRQDEDFPNDCNIRAQAPARADVVQLSFDQVASGTYAFAAFHDSDNDGKLAMNASGFPAEGLAFSNDAIGRAGPPTFTQSAFRLGEDEKALTRIRYFGIW